MADISDLQTQIGIRIVIKKYAWTFQYLYLKGNQNIHNNPIAMLYKLFEKLKEKFLRS